MRESQKTMKNGNYIQNYIHIYIQKWLFFTSKKDQLQFIACLIIIFLHFFPDRLFAVESSHSLPGFPKGKYKLEVSEINKIQTISLFRF